MYDSQIAYLPDGTPMPSGDLDVYSLTEMWAAHPLLAAVVLTTGLLVFAVRHPTIGAGD
jgi:hypothetical protein